MPIDRSRMTFIRYCTDPLIAMLNPAMDGAMNVHRLDGNGNNAAGSWQESGRIVSDDTEYLLQDSDGVPALSGLQRQSGKHILRLAFDPPFPNLAHMKADAETNGSFVLSGDPSTGRINGDYTVRATGESIEIELVPSGGWSPEPDRFSLRVLYRVAGMFLKWPETFRWTTSMARDETEHWHMQSRWERTDR